MTDRDEMIEVVLPVLEKCFDSDWNMTYSEMVTDALITAGYRKIFDGDCGLAGIKDPDEREAAEAWMRFSNIVLGNGHDGIGAMKQMLTELGYRKPRYITTAEELDALPAWSVVRSDEATIWEKFNGGHTSDDFWGETMTHGKHPASHIALPATVLWEPKP